MANSLYDPRYKRLIERLISERKRNGMTQRDVAARLKQPASYVGKVETGQRRVDLIELVDMLEAMGVKPSKFITDALSELKRR